MLNLEHPGFMGRKLLGPCFVGMLARVRVSQPQAIGARLGGKGWWRICVKKWTALGNQDGPMGHFGRVYLAEL